MSLLAAHLDSISASAESIATLPFPPPKIFTNALLAPHDITALIRDTEPHERALFSVPPPPPPITQPAPTSPKPNRRQTVFNVASGEVTAGNPSSTRAPRRNTAVAAVLGGDLHSQIKRTEGLKNGELDVELLLRGAEKLGTVYALPGMNEEIARLRHRYGQLRTSVDYYEGKVEKQRRELESMNRAGDDDEDEEGMDDDGYGDEGVEVTEEDLWREEEEIMELEKRKRELEERIGGMERDLGGLMR